MKIIEPSFFLYVNVFRLNEENGSGLLRWVESMARISHRSEGLQTNDTWKKFIPAVVLGHGDWSVTEHASVTAVIRTDRGITHELVRHRLFSFTQESTRFVRYKDELEFIRPAELKPFDSATWGLVMSNVEKSYHDLLSLGNRPQEARSILPNALATTIAVTGNLRNWRHFFLMRTSKETHPDFKRITIPMLTEFKRFIPFLYDDIVPDARQIDNLSRPR